MRPTSIEDKAFGRHRRTAQRRGIQFLLTFDEWWSIWKSSGHWHERGNRKGCYVMARFFDRGAYEKGNVRIIKHEVNSYLGMKGNKNALGVKRSADTKAKIGAASKGRKHTTESKARISAGIRAKFTPEELSKIGKRASSARWKKQTCFKWVKVL